MKLKAKHSEVLNRFEGSTNQSLIEPRTSLTHPIALSWLFAFRTVTQARSHSLAGSTSTSSTGFKAENTGSRIPVPIRTQTLSHSDINGDTGGRKDFEREEAGIALRNSVICKEANDNAITKLSWNGNFALSSCPGKKVRLNGAVNGRAMISRELSIDFQRIASFGVRTVIWYQACYVSCLDDYELKHLGAKWELYHQEAQNCGMEVVRIPIVEGNAPESVEEVEAVFRVIDSRSSPNHNVLCHCRGGIGRAGLIACCYLIRNR
jgi:protein tyrosine phosphatase (PTP) superfamily phosphohydrolase (DUF442 family)